MKDPFLANIATRVSRLCETQMYTTERMTVGNLLSAVFVKRQSLKVLICGHICGFTIQMDVFLAETAKKNSKPNGTLKTIKQKLVP